MEKKVLEKIAMKSSTPEYTMKDATGLELSIGDHVVFMNLVNGEGYSSNTMGTGKIEAFTSKMVKIASARGTSIHRLPSKIAKTFKQS